ncbi:MAG: Holliday junction branch migration protein RuvA [Planctomycetota bacterium]
MFDFVSGFLVQCEGDRAVIETGGLGYSLVVPESTARELRGQERARLFTSMRVRDDRLVIYGFASREERSVFERLCTISGVGPGTAITILSGIPLAEFRMAIIDGQVQVLTRIKGIGRKTAERLVLELREVFGREPVSALRLPANQLEEDATGALVALGVPLQSAQEAVRRALRELPSSPSLEDVIKAASRRA